MGMRLTLKNRVNGFGMVYSGLFPAWIGLGPDWSSSDQAVPGLACSVRVSSGFVFLLWSWCVRRWSRSGFAFTLLIGWFLGWSGWSVSHPASRLVMVSSGFAAGYALPVPMALAPCSMLGSAFGAVIAPGF